ncbi:MAG TPA: YtxH domain-containing protein [Candidatus Koribacter sp.]|jgi:gas vesicle protein
MNDIKYRGFGQTPSYESGRGGAGLGLTLLLVGLGIGAITALLLAPDSGRKTRKRLRRRYEDARERIDDFTDQASDAWERGSEWASDAYAKGSDWADDARKRAVKMNKRVKPIRKSIFG